MACGAGFWAGSRFRFGIVPALLLREPSPMRAPAASLALMIVTATSAQAMPSTLQMTCSQAASLVVSRGAVVLRTGPNTYDRYVSGQGFCARAEVAVPEWVPTVDATQCFIGYRCDPRYRRDRFRD